jgi:hypothetical protein
MGLTSSFNLSWADFLTTWCLNQTRGFSYEHADTALSALERFWPERLEEFFKWSAKGAAAVGPLVHHGNLLVSCEHLRGFEGVMNRIRIPREQNAALSELRLAATLVSLGYQPELEPLLGGRRPDAVIRVESHPIYFEVISPKISDATKKELDLMLGLANQLAKENLGSHLEVFLTGEIDPAVSEGTLTFARATSFSTRVYEMPGIGFLKKQEASKVSGLGDVGSSTAGPIVGVAHATNEGGVRDDRAARLLEAETKHFSKDEINVVVIDLSKIPRGVDLFPALIRPRLQPRINCRFSAVILFFDSVVGSGLVVTEWKVIVNPNAHRHIPDSFIQSLSSLKAKFAT